MVEKALYYYNNKTYGEATNYLDELIRSDSTNGEYYFKRGYCYSNLSKEDLAFFNYIKAIEYKYAVAESNLNIAIIFIKYDKDSLALSYLQESLNAGHPKDKKMEELIKICKDNIVLQKTDAWKEYQEYKARKIKSQ